MHSHGRPWERVNEEDYRAHVDYVYINPVKHGLVGEVRDWPYSTFHRLGMEEAYEENWMGGLGDDLSYLD